MWLINYRLKKMLEASANSSQAPMSQGSQPESESHLESVNESEAIEIDDDEEIEIEPSDEEDAAEVGSKRKLTSIV